jgi:hypothetical protein
MINRPTIVIMIAQGGVFPPNTTREEPHLGQQRRPGEMIAGGWTGCATCDAF